MIFQGHFLLFDLAWSKLSQFTVTIVSINSQDMIAFMITTEFLKSQGMIRILIQSGHDFSGEIYVMDNLWILYDDYVWRLNFNRWLYGFVKLL